MTEPMRRIYATAYLAGLLLAGAACSDMPPPASANCISDAGFSVELYGDLRTTLSWDSSELECAGMPRPFGDGARLRFAGPAMVEGEARRLAFIVALPALQRGATARELLATVTLMEENNGRFYSNQDSEICWSDVTAQEALADSSNDYAIRGIVYCLAPLVELNGSGSVTLRELRYSGRVSWPDTDS